MDVLLNFVHKYGFTRLNSKLGKPVVFHCVPGAGKSSCIRDILDFDSRFRAYTLGIEDPPNLRNNRICKYTGELDTSKYNLLDEYNLEAVELGQFTAVFGDPIQTDLSTTLRADFISTKSYRFGTCTAQLLRDLGFEIEAAGQDVVQVRGVYEVDPVDQVLYFEEEVGCLLRRNFVEALHIKDAIGQTYRSVTFVTGHQGVPRAHRAAVYQCLTRHRQSLLIMCPDGTYTTA